MGDNKPHVIPLPKQVCMTHLHWICLITEGRRNRQEIHQDVLLPLIGPDGKYKELWVFLRKFLLKLDLGPFPRNLGMDMTRVHPPGQLTSNLALNCGCSLNSRSVRLTTYGKKLICHGKFLKITEQQTPVISFSSFWTSHTLKDYSWHAWFKCSRECTRAFGNDFWTVNIEALPLFVFLFLENN